MIFGARPLPGRSLGLDARERAESPYARFLRPMRASLAEPVTTAIQRGPVAPGRVTALRDAATLCSSGSDHGALETAYAITEDGEARVAVETRMPGCSAAMVDWWFGWHADDAVRYKLWHPGAHVHACWTDPTGDRSGRARYVGRTSHVDEYLGSSLGRFAIRFVAPDDLGLTHASLAPGGDATAICARIGLVEVPLDVGYLLHHVAPTSEGVVMRSRFWLGGEHAALRGAGRLGGALGRRASRWLRPSERDAVDLLVHCAEEMTHLASILPDLHAAHGRE